MRKAAILVSALDHRLADALLDRMPAADAARVRNAVLDLDEVSEDEQQVVLAEFLRAGGPRASGEAGVELDESLARKLAAPERPPTCRTAAAAATPSAWFRSLHLVPAESIARHLKPEHPQIIAVVLAHLPAQRSAEVVKLLPDRLQADVLRRVADLDAADPQVLHELECELERRLSGEIRAARVRATGLSTVASILEAAGEEREVWLKKVSLEDESLLPLVGAHSGKLAGEARPDSPRSATAPHPSAVKWPREVQTPVPPAAGEQAPGASRKPLEPAEAARGVSFSFDDIERLDDRGLARLFAAAEPELTLIALSGAGDGLLTRIMRQLPARQARLLQRQMQHLGPLRLSDIEQAQHRLTHLAVDLMTQGEIGDPTTPRLAAAA